MPDSVASRIRLAVDREFPGIDRSDQDTRSKML
jgi:hypothetical protein